MSIYRYYFNLKLRVLCDVDTEVNLVLRGRAPVKADAISFRHVQRQQALKENSIHVCRERMRYSSQGQILDE